MPLFIKKSPSPQTLLSRTYADECPAGYEPSTEADAAAWVDAQLAAGWTPTPVEPVLSAADAEALLDDILDGWAREWGYASSARCITYVGDPDATFNAEGVAMRNARSALWVAVRAAAANPDTPAYTEANVRAFAAQFKPTRP